MKIGVMILCRKGVLFTECGCRREGVELNDSDQLEVELRLERLGTGDGDSGWGTRLDEQSRLLHHPPVVPMIEEESRITEKKE